MEERIMKVINIIGITCIVAVLFIVLPAIAQENQYKSEEAASNKKISESFAEKFSKAISTNSSPPPQKAQTFPTSHRDQHMKPDEVIKAINVRPGSVIVDIGAGDGYFTRRLAVAATPSGKAMALDINPKMVLKAREDSKNYPNYEARLVPANDPMLEPNSVDIVFICATYHEMENRIDYFTRLKKGLRKDARLFIIDMDKSNAENESHSIEMETVIKELESAGYKLIKESEILKPRHFFLEFNSK